MKRWRVRPAQAPLRGAVRVPGDRSVGRYALVLSSLAVGPGTLSGLPSDPGTLALRAALSGLGVSFEPDARGVLRVGGVRLRGLRAPAGPIDCDGSGATMRLLAGLLAAQHFESRLVGGASLSQSPMACVT